jgi:hypothetical protein
MKYPYIQVDIYENNKYPAVTHVFHGETAAEAQGYFKAHMKTDSFLRAAVNTGYYKGMRVRVSISGFNGE